MRKRIAVAGTGYVGLSLATLLSQNNEVIAVDIVYGLNRSRSGQALLKHILGIKGCLL